MVDEIKFKVPAKNEPGFLRRQLDSAQYSLAWKKVKQVNHGEEVSEEHLTALVAAWDETVDYLLGFVVEPTDRARARELLLDQSEDVIDQLLDLASGKSSTVPLSNAPK